MENEGDASIASGMPAFAVELIDQVNTRRNIGYLPDLQRLRVAVLYPRKQEEPRDRESVSCSSASQGLQRSVVRADCSAFGIG